jgi:UDP-N-acetylmuramoylalanine--D-glutamate ligase
MGLGLQGGGVEVVRYMAGERARVTVTDLRPAEQLAESLRAIAGFDVRLVLGQHRAEDFTQADVVVANPAVAPSNPMLAAAREAGVLVTSEMALFLEACPARVVLITGTQGKSSTTNAAAQLLASAGLRVHLGGNIGHALLGDLASIHAEDIAVVEISSYQLEALPPDLGPCAQVAAVCVTNVLADHIERHGTIEAYEAAKRRILDLAGDDATLVLSGEDPRVSSWSPARGHVVRVYATQARDDELNIAGGSFRHGREVLGRVADLQLPGVFQRENMLAALGLARALGASPQRLSASIHDVRGLEHRLQDLGVFAGHRVWDNAVSTTPDSTLSALRALSRPPTLLCGGQAKNLSLEELTAQARTLAKRVITFGVSNELLADAFRDAEVETHVAGSVEDAVRLAFESMASGEELLFSPACASFDAYRNFSDRARAFRAALPRAPQG